MFRSLRRPVGVALTAVLAATLVFLAAPRFAATTDAANGGPWIKVGEKAGPVGLGNDPITVASLPLAAGSYSITAQLSAQASGDFVGCTLSFGGDSDSGSVGSNASGKHTMGTISLSVAASSFAKGNAAIWCHASQIDSYAQVSDIKITAIRAGTLNVVNLD